MIKCNLFYLLSVQPQRKRRHRLNCRSSTQKNERFCSYNWPIFYFSNELRRCFNTAPCKPSMSSSRLLHMRQRLTRYSYQVKGFCFNSKSSRHCCRRALENNKPNNILIIQPLACFTCLRKFQENSYCSTMDSLAKHTRA